MELINDFMKPLTEFVCFVFHLEKAEDVEEAHLEISQVIKISSIPQLR